MTGAECYLGNGYWGIFKDRDFLIVSRQSFSERKVYFYELSIYPGLFKKYCIFVNQIKLLLNYSTDIKH